MNFLFIIDYFTPSKWWVERLFEDIISSLSKDWHNIKILTCRFDKKLSKYEKKWNIEIFRIWKSRFSFMFFGGFVGLKLLKNIEIIHTSTYNAAYVAKFLSWFSNASVVLTSHEILWKVWYEFKGRRWFFYKKFEDFIYKFWFFYVFVTNHVKNVAITSYKLDINQITTIYNWIDDIKIEWKIKKKDLWFKENDLIWIFSWRPWRTKWLDFLLQNFEEIRKINPNFKLLLLILEKNNSKKIWKILKKIKNNNSIKIIFEIKHQEVYEYLNLADIGIVCSKTEGFWYSGVEFSKLWKTTVLSNIGGIPEINFWDCHFFKVCNSESFLKAFEDIFKNKKNNYSNDKLNSVENMNKKYEKVYNFLIEK